MCNAIQPANVARVLIDEDRNTIELIVPDDQLSCDWSARAKRSSGCRKLVGWKIEINSDEKVEQVKRELWWYMVEERGLDGERLDYLFKLGYHSPENILNADEEELTLSQESTSDFAQQIQQLSFEVRKKKESDTLGLPEGFHDTEEEDGLEAAMRELKHSSPAAGLGEGNREESAESRQQRRDLQSEGRRGATVTEVCDEANETSNMCSLPAKKRIRLG